MNYNANIDIFSEFIKFYQDFMRKIDRFLKYLESKGITENKATMECGLSQGILSQAKSGKADLGNRTIDKILNKYQDLNRVWLITGEGEMTYGEERDTNSENSNIIKAILLTLEMQRESNRKLMEQMDRILKTNEDLVNNNRVLTEIISKRGLAEDASGAAGMAAVAVQG